MAADNDAHSTTASGNFLEHKRAGNVIQACTTPFFWHRDTHETESPHLGDQLARVTPLFIPSDRIGHDFLTGEPPCEVSDLVMNVIFEGEHRGFRWGAVCPVWIQCVSEIIIDYLSIFLNSGRRFSFCALPPSFDSSVP